MPPVRVIGIDPGSERTGWGVVDSDGRAYKLVNYGVIVSPPIDAFPKRLAKISSNLETIFAEYQPQACAVEDAFFAVNVKTALKLGQVRGAILLTAERAALEIGEYAPRLVKQSVVGYGAAEKGQVQEMVRILLNLRVIPQPNDASDALAIAICHINHAAAKAHVSRADAKILAALTTKRRAAR